MLIPEPHTIVEKSNTYNFLLFQQAKLIVLNYSETVNDEIYSVAEESAVKKATTFALVPFLLIFLIIVIFIKSTIKNILF